MYTQSLLKVPFASRLLWFPSSQQSVVAWKQVVGNC
uniref:Uncharacterized protein n=1 Tax=Anguilla anguilla TaxID=7936 RepID=A0A0E9U9U6_ANGAN